MPGCKSRLEAEAVTKKAPTPQITGRRYRFIDRAGLGGVYLKEPAKV
jgi:hypothetical protein